MSIWASRRLIERVAALDESNLSDDQLNALIRDTMNNIKALLFRWGFQDYEKWYGEEVPVSIKLATVYGTVAALWAERPELFESTGIIHEQNAMEYWEARFERAITQFLRTKSVNPVRVRELVSSIHLPFE
jgi:asparagine synthetase B (glutamine-hydrolysing)